MPEKSFGQLLSFYRRQCSDPLRGGLLTQERLGELLGVALGDAGYTSAAVSYWEQDKSRLSANDRLVLVGLVTVLHQCGGLRSPAEADELLYAGNYRALDANERLRAFPDLDQAQEEAASLSEWTAVAKRESQTSPMSLPAPPSRTRRKQLILLHKVKNFWVDGVLQASIGEATLLESSLQRCDEAIDHPWLEIMGPAAYDHDGFQEEETIYDLFADSDRALLILGEPGTGKTTTLILLAKDLITQAESDPAEPIPVILNLASWSEQRTAMTSWIAEELTAKYQIPRKTAAEWLNSDELLLLLDGLDEVPDRLRRRCIETINHFRKEQGLTGIVVCSRSQEYWTSGVRLKLGGAIRLQPLTPEKIDTYLASTGPRLEALRKAVKKDVKLEEMARSPLMLSVMAQAYSYSQEDLVGVLDAPPDAESGMAFWRQRLFGTYVQRMFQRRGSRDEFPSESATLWLAWLARQLFAHNQAQIFIEQIQPSWLPKRGWRWLYMLISGLLTGLVGGIIMWLFLQLLRENIPFLPAPLSAKVAGLLPIGQGGAEVFSLIAANILLGLVVAVIQGRYFEQLRLQQAESASSGWRYWRHLALVGLIVGLLTGVTVAAAGLPQLAIIWAVAEIVLYVTAARYVFGRSYLNEIRTVEALSWAWKSAAKGLVVGLVLSVVTELLGAFIFSAPISEDSAVILGFGGLILGGLRGRKVEAKSRPNQGIYLSLRNSFLAATLSGIPLGLLAWIMYSSIYGLLTALLTFIIAGSILGGSNVVKHFLVRTLLWFNHDIPWRYADFLDYSAALAFLRKVGGGYIFSHRILQQYFASINPPPNTSVKIPASTLDPKRPFVRSRSA